MIMPVVVAHLSQETQNSSIFDFIHKLNSTVFCVSFAFGGSRMILCWCVAQNDASKQNFVAGNIHRASERRIDSGGTVTFYSAKLHIVSMLKNVPTYVATGCGRGGPCKAVKDQFLIYPTFHKPVAYVLKTSHKYLTSKFRAPCSPHPAVYSHYLLLPKAKFKKFPKQISPAATS
jgi:hypothetical protein